MTSTGRPWSSQCTRALEGCHFSILLADLILISLLTILCALILSLFSNSCKLVFKAMASQAALSSGRVALSKGSWIPEREEVSGVSSPLPLAVVMEAAASFLVVSPLACRVTCPGAWLAVIVPICCSKLLVPVFSPSWATKAVASP